MSFSTAGGSIYAGDDGDGDDAWRQDAHLGNESWRGEVVNWQDHLEYHDGTDRPCPYCQENAQEMHMRAKEWMLINPYRDAEYQNAENDAWKIVASGQFVPDTLR